MPVILRLLLLIVSLMCVFTPSECWLCHSPGQQCRPADCQEPLTNTGTNSTLLDSCNCCPVSSRKEHETCGGKNYSLGKCLEGFQCVLPLEQGYNFTGYESGECQNSASYCRQIQTYHGCVAVGNYCSCVTVPSCSVVKFRFSDYDECKRAISGQDSEATVPKSVDGACLFKNKYYENGKEWRLDNCSQCTCQNGVTLCRRIQCNSIPENCGRIIPKGECCPVCIGCVSPSGHWYNNLETWKEDDCTTCGCFDGRVRCQAEMCQSNCPHPKQVPGHCCPVCEGNCDLVCPNGYKKNATGHPVCECERIVEKEKCPSMEKCKKACMHGFKVDSIGCERCKCIKCPENPDCDKQCQHGFHVDDQGCPVCKCKGVEDATNAMPSTSSLNRVCLSKEGVPRAEGSFWYDGCHTCTCKNGHVLCSLLTCPKLHCDRPQKYQGQCCPVCPDVPTVPHSRCEHENVLYESGETWRANDCMQCVCVSGHKFCTEQTCQHSCQNSVRIPGQCCPVCTGLVEQSSGFSGVLAILVIMCIILVALLVAVGFLVMLMFKRHNGSLVSFRHVCPWKTKGSMTLKCPKSTQLDYRASFYDYAEPGVKPVSL